MNCPNCGFWIEKAERLEKFARWIVKMADLFSDSTTKRLALEALGENEDDTKDHQKCV
jgi:hypothetical protein